MFEDCERDLHSDPRLFLRSGQVNGVVSLEDIQPC